MSVRRSTPEPRAPSSRAAKGFTNGEIGKILGISVNVDKGHMKLIFEQLGVASRAEAMSRALSLGLINN